MRNLRYYYAADICDFLKQSTAEILGLIHSNDMSAETTIQQSLRCSLYRATLLVRITDRAYTNLHGEDNAPD